MIKTYFQWKTENLIDQIEKFKVIDTQPFFHLNKNIVGESQNSKLNKISRYLKKNKSDYLFISAPENVAWTLNIRGKDGPNTPMPNSRLVVSKTKKIYLSFLLRNQHTFNLI